MTPGIWQILIVLVLALLLFGGRGRIANIMGDLARGITSFRQGLKEGEEDSTEEASSGETTSPRAIENTSASESEPVDVTPEPEPSASESDRRGG